MDALTIAVMGAVTAVVLAGIGSAIGVGLGGQASAGVMSEDPEKFGKLLILTGLPGTQGIYGFVAGFLAIMRLGLLGGDAAADITIAQGWQMFFACLPVGLAGLVSAVHQGRVCAAGIEMTAKQPAESGKAMVMGIFVELYAVLGFVITFLLLFSIKI
jgi:V/A-type H+/Na+-transporting ATPase subunit K